MKELRVTVIMYSKFIFVTIFALLGVCNSAYVDNIKKCSYTDETCITNFLQKVLKDISKTGIDELNIPPIDPLKLKGVNLPITGFFNITLDDGDVHGIQDCSINKIRNNFESEVTLAEYTCDLLIQAKVHITDASEFVRSLFGQNSKDGYGSIEMKLEKIHMKLQLYYNPIKKGENVFFQINTDKFRSEYEIENIHLKGDKLTFGAVDVTEIAENFVNQNWKSLLSTIGKNMLDVAMKIFLNIFSKFFENVPPQKYYIEDINAVFKN